MNVNDLERLDAGDGRAWVHLKTAEQLATALAHTPSFNLDRVYRTGGVPESKGEGFVALLDEYGEILLMGVFTAGDVQFPATPDSTPPMEIRKVFHREIEELRAGASELLGAEAPHPSA